MQKTNTTTDATSLRLRRENNTAEKPIKKDYSKGAVRLFLCYIHDCRKLFLIDMACAVAVAAIDLIFPYVSRTALNTMLPGRLYKSFFAVMGILFAAYILKAALNYVVTVVGHRMGVLTEANMRRDIFTHMQELSFSFYDKNRTGVLMSRITSDLFEIAELSHHGPENLLICTLTIIGSMVFMFSMEWRLALVLAVMLPLCMWFTLKQRVKQKKANIEVKEKYAQINATIESSISGIRTAKAFANEEKETEKFNDANKLFLTAKNEYYKAMGLFMSGMEFTTGIMPVLVIAIGGLLIMAERMDYVTLVTFSLYVAVFVSPLRKLSQFMETYMAGSAGFERFLEIMRTGSQIKDSPDAEELRLSRGKIEYKDVCFSYDNGVPVLEDINLKIEPGEVFAAVGPSGSGKTTLCQLLPRFYDVTGGSIEIDGQDIRTVTQSSLRKNIGIIQQDVFMFAGTIRENIRYGRPEATDSEVVEAAVRAEIHKEIMEMPDGYDSYIGERGIMLSGGQKQRLSIARVFLKNPKILILDEATSALDTVTEQKIQSALDELREGRTTLIIAHRLSTIKNADRIAVIEDEKVAEMGTHRELMELNGIYAELCRAQSLQEE